MKKLAVSLFVLFALSSVCSAEVSKLQVAKQVVSDEYYAVPQWDEYCPPEYLNAVHIQPTFWNQLSVTGKINIKYNNYWVTRKYSFVEQLTACSYAPEKHKKDCYQALRDAENNKNVLFKEEQQRDSEEMAAQREYYQRQRELNNDYYLKKEMIDAMKTPKNYNINVNSK